MNFRKCVTLSTNKRLCIKFQLQREIVPLEKKYKKNDKIKHKVFCIGFGKTGTTSLELALKNFGYRMGNQAVSEMMVEDWYNQKSERIVKFCHTADAFQDMPFGMPNLYKELDKSFPKSKFILTVRDNEEQWYNSLVSFHAKLWSKDGVSPPTEEELNNAIYRYKGWALDMMKLNSEYPEVPLYDRRAYLSSYLCHISDVKDYFKDRQEDLLILNVAEHASYQKLAKYLGVDVDANETFPWENKT